MEMEEILEKMKPEHAEVIKAHIAEIEKAKAEAESARDEAQAELEKANDVCPKCGKSPCVCEDDDDVDKATEGKTSFDDTETLTKGLAPELAEYIQTLEKQKAAAEEVAKSAIAREKHLAAVAKAAELKSLPIEESQLVSFIEKSSVDTVDMLSAIAKGIESTVLAEVGSDDTGSFAKSANAAWDVLESKAEAIAKERSVSKAKGMSIAIEEHPELYREYLEGGAN